jgi:hypothetical protein
MATTKLTLDDIADLRAYEKEREEFRAHVIELKRRRRIGVGTLVTLVFENRDTVRFQIQEMARAERMLSDEQIQVELDTYNTLVPEPGQVAASLFIELTSKDQLMEWLPKLVGIERSIELRIGEGDDAVVVRSVPEDAHEAQLTREEVTASVHYVFFRFTPDEVALMDSGAPVVLAVAHPAYDEATELSVDTVEGLLDDIR